LIASRNYGVGKKWESRTANKSSISFREMKLNALGTKESPGAKLDPEPIKKTPSGDGYRRREFIRNGKRI
jgi:hypothetical protein